MFRNSLLRQWEKGNITLTITSTWPKQVGVKEVVNIEGGIADLVKAKLLSKKDHQEIVMHIRRTGINIGDKTYQYKGNAASDDGSLNNDWPLLNIQGLTRIRLNVCRKNGVTVICINDKRIPNRDAYMILGLIRNYILDNIVLAAGYAYLEDDLDSIKVEVTGIAGFNLNRFIHEINNQHFKHDGLPIELVEVRPVG
jgi:hypothetical protein